MTIKEEIALLRQVLVHFWVSQFLPLFMRKWLHTDNSVGDKIRHEIRRKYKRLNYPPTMIHTYGMLHANKAVIQLMHTAMFLPESISIEKTPAVKVMSKDIMLKAIRYRKRELQDYVERQGIGQEQPTRRC